MRTRQLLGWPRSDLGYPSDAGAAQADLVDYVRENWDAEMEVDPPDDEDDLVKQYFETVLEAYTIGETA